MKPDSTITDAPSVARPADIPIAKDCVAKVSDHARGWFGDPGTRTQAVPYFIVTVLGFSFWFFTAVPFVSHRETYWWLAMVQSQPFVYAFGVISSTYRPLAQGTTWLAFLILKPSIFPTDVLRQTLLQGFIYGMFVIAWWLIYSRAVQRRLFALVALIVGGVFFSGYVHLFHIYGLFYVPVMLTLGTLLHFQGSTNVGKREVWFAVVATLLVFWHPFATALFIGFFFGFYLDTFWQRRKSQHIQAILIVVVGTVAIIAMVGLFARTPMPLASRFFGFLVSYRTNEINLVSSLVAFVLTQIVVFSVETSTRVKLVASAAAAGLSFLLLWKAVPLLFVWVCAVLIKLAVLRCWRLFFLAGTAILLPFGGGIGTPMYALFAIIVATYATALGWSKAENVLSGVKAGYVTCAITASVIIVLMIRVGIDVPIVTRVANPILTERERTYQLENILAWLHNSDYCACELAFAEDAGNPVDSLENVISRRNRPPSSLADVQLFWKTILQCPKAEHPATRAGSVLLTFGGAQLADSNPVYRVGGVYAGDAVVWVRNSQR